MRSSGKGSKYVLTILLINIIPIVLVLFLGVFLLFFYPVNKYVLLGIMVILPLFVSPVMFFLNKRTAMDFRTEISMLKDQNMARSLNLREINHRVKNNMNMIIALLEIQKSGMDSSCRDYFDQPIKRVQTMSLLHEKLYSGGDGTSIDLIDLAKEIANSVIGSELRKSGKISLRLNCTSIIINADLATTMGLLINELLTNSVKHAFPGNRTGIITMDFSAGPSFYTFHYEDNGVGFQIVTEHSKSTSLGMLIINSLSGQLGGKFSIDHEKGMSYKLVFPRDIRSEGQKTQTGLYRQMVFNRAFTDMTIQMMNNGISEHSYSLVLNQAVSAIEGCDRGCILELKDDHRFYFITSFGIPLRSLRRSGSLSLNDAFISPMGKGGVRIVNDMGKINQSNKDFFKMAEIREINSIIVAPVKLNNAYLAFLYLGRSDSNLFNEESLFMARVFASQLSLILEHFKF